MNIDQLKIVIAEPSVIIRSGITVALKRVPGFRIQPVEFNSIDSLKNYLNLHNPDVLIVNPVYWGNLNISKLKEDTHNPDLKCISLIYSAVDSNFLKGFDESLGVYDTIEQMKEKLEKIIIQESNVINDETTTLSPREKEIIVAVVKGLTNKEVANSLNLSTHTVISHRRNIARKLEIHSTAGLTIFAIMNKLIELDDVRNE